MERGSILRRRGPQAWPGRQPGRAALILSLIVGAGMVPPPAGAQFTEYVSERDVMVPTRDGVALATDIHRPS
ncbi:MAG: hypothetical protein OEO23_12910, partial [Gemmatimonadota bacterium]|nr:hypothetical protein [Gemmatimonadota bacterium]